MPRSKSHAHTFTPGSNSLPSSCHRSRSHHRSEIGIRHRSKRYEIRRICPAGKMATSENIDHKRGQTLWKVLEIAAGVVALALWLTSVFLWMHYASTRPHSLDAGSGRIYPLNTHGSVVYLTCRENLFIAALTVGGIIVFAAGVCIDVFKNPIRRRLRGNGSSVSNKPPDSRTVR